MKNVNDKGKKLEVLLWSIAFPGFGQIINRKYLKAILLIISEFLINVKAGINVVIISSFSGDMHTAINEVNYQWLMFYPCIYLFAIWDAYRDVGETKAYSYLPFVLSAYFGTIGVIYSATFKLFGYLIGPIFLPIICIVIGSSIGIVIKKRCIKN